MKKTLMIASSLLFIISCTSNDSKTTEASKSNNEVGVQNPNGNIPDTTNAINLGHKKDTTRIIRDSTR